MSTASTAAAADMAASAIADEIKVHPVLTFDGEVKENMKDELQKRMDMLKYYTGAGKAPVGLACKIFNELQDMENFRTENFVRNLMSKMDAKEFHVLNRQADPNDGFQLKLVKGLGADRKPIFTNKIEEALSVTGVFFLGGGVVVRIFSGYIPEKVLEDGTKVSGRNATQVTVELFNGVVPDEMTQDWVNDNVLGLSAYAFKVDGEQICPAGSWGQHGVNPKLTNPSVLNELMSRCHLPVF